MHRSATAAAVVMLATGAVACGAGHAPVEHAAAADQKTPGGPARIVPVVKPVLPAPSPVARVATVGASPSPAPVRPVVKPAVAAPPSVPASPYFATPEDSMRYLAAAYNRNDVAALVHVTTPASRSALQSMHSEAVNLQLKSCTRNSAGDYRCDFTHDFPAAMHRTGHGTATFIAAPATLPGWYMYLFVTCG